MTTTTSPNMQNEAIAAVVSAIDWTKVQMFTGAEGRSYRLATVYTNSLLIGRAGRASARFTTGTGTVLHGVRLYATRDEETGIIVRLTVETQCGLRPTHGAHGAHGRVATCRRCKPAR
jgi:hypothetical protein